MNKFSIILVPGLRRGNFINGILYFSLSIVEYGFSSMVNFLESVCNFLRRSRLIMRLIVGRKMGL